jgi:hypothetical protein
LINPQGLGYLTSPWIEVRDNDTKYKSSFEITTQYFHTYAYGSEIEMGMIPITSYDYGYEI